MKREFVIGGFTGMAFGLLGLIFVGWIFTSGTFTTTWLLDRDVLTVIITGLLFSFLFGGWATQRITCKTKSPYGCGIASSFLTTTCTVVFLGLITGFTSGENLLETLSVILTLLIYSDILGGIPMLILGSLFGFIVKEVIKPKTLEQ